MGNRKKISQDIETKILTQSRRRCALCFGLDNDLMEKKGQIAHIDKNSANNKFDNLVYLCFMHHDSFDSITSQSKNYTRKEVKHYREELYKYYIPTKKARFENLPNQRPNEVAASPHPVFGFIDCPNCNASTSEITEKVFGDNYHKILTVKCRICGWSDKTEV